IPYIRSLLVPVVPEPRTFLDTWPSLALQHIRCVVRGRFGPTRAKTQSGGTRVRSITTPPSHPHRRPGDRAGHAAGRSLPAVTRRGRGLAHHRVAERRILG